MSLADFVSSIDCPIIDESNIDQFMGHDGTFEPRDWDEVPCGTIASDGVPCAPEVPIKKIDRAEWPERIRDKEKFKANLSDKIHRAGMRAKMQSATNFCASNATVGAMQVARIIQGQEHVELSPASVACIITNYRNVGHWPGKVVQYLASKRGGAVPVSMWPANQIDQRLDTPAVSAERPNNRCTEWWDVPKFDFDLLATVVLNDVSAATVYMRIKHVVLSLDLKLLDGKGRFGMKYLNSYSINWGNQGYAIMPEHLARPDEAICPRVVT